MRSFEDLPEQQDNLGNNPDFIALDELAIDENLRPDEILMEKEENDDTDAEPSNWEEDVENGKYDTVGVQEDLAKVETKSNPVRTTSRNNIVRIEEMQGREQLERYWDEPNQKTDNSKPKRPQDNRDSIRFDDAV